MTRESSDGGLSLRTEDAGKRLQERLRVRRLGHERTWFARRGDLRAPTIDDERDASLCEPRAGRCAVIRAKDQVENGSGQAVLLCEAQTLVQGCSFED